MPTETIASRRLGANGPQVFPISLGCMGMSGMYGHADENESIATIHAALDRGMNLIDTGDFYGMGHNEMLVGRALKGRRDKALHFREIRRAARAGRKLARLRRPPGRREIVSRAQPQSPGREPHRCLPPRAPRSRTFPSRTPSAPSPT